jgi:hypothetical protein
MRLNRHLFTETATGSGSINVLGTVVHRFPEAGRYRVEFLRDGEYVANASLAVEEGAPPHTTVDIAELVSGGVARRRRDESCCGDATDEFRVRPEGYVSFVVSSGPGGYAVTAAPVRRRKGRSGGRPDEDGEKDRAAFDSRELGEGDRFAVLLLRPGTYVATERNAGSEARISVPYPEGRERGKGMPEAETLRLTDDGFDPKEAKVTPGQGLVFEVERGRDARLRVELREPHERARDEVGGGPGRRWERPGLERANAPVDPGEMSVDDLRKELKRTRSQAALRRLLRAEARGKNRESAKREITRRLREVGTDR